MHFSYIVKAIVYLRIQKTVYRVFMWTVFLQMQRYLSSVRVNTWWRVYI